MCNPKDIDIFYIDFVFSALLHLALLGADPDNIQINKIKDIKMKKIKERTGRANNIL